ncbi:MAG: hypothetical protein QXV58_14835 [Saccharolobus sp.]|uniref:hypothetical protein n=1 Tax=Saccharolobus sp. TaxID=2100761 RepID=UPI003162AC3C
MMLEDLKYQVRDIDKYPFIMEVQDVEITEVSSDGQELTIDDVVTVLVPMTKEEIIEFVRDNPQTSIVVYDSKTLTDVTEEFKRTYMGE